jgi:peptide/nickel transport system substrate-binding protein
MAALACGEPADTDASGSSAEPGRAETEPTTLTLIASDQMDAKAVTPYYGGTSMHLLYLPLFAYGDDGDLEGRLVNRWEHSTDYREWTYHLRTNVRWHDGTPFTAQDVAFTYEVWEHPEVLRSMPGACVVNVVDDSTYTMTANEGCDPQNWWQVMLPSHLLEHLEGKAVWDAGMWENPIGNGPYRFLRYTPGTAIELEANADFYAGRPRIDRVILKLMPGGGNPLVELEAGNVDFAVANGRALERLARDPRFVVYWGRPQLGWPVLWNHRHPILGDSSIRKALTQAIDKTELGQLYQYPAEAPIVDVPIPHSRWSGLASPAPAPFEPDASREVLERLGWKDGDGDGVRERDGDVLAFEMLISRAGERAGVLIQAQLAAIGVEVKLRSMDRRVVRERIDAGDFEAALADGLKGSGLLWTLAGSEPDWNSPIGYQNLSLPAIVTTLETSFHPGERRRAEQELQEIFRNDQPMSPVVPNMGNASLVANRRVKGLSSPLLRFPEQAVDRLWIKDEEDEK